MEALLGVKKRKGFDWHIRGVLLWELEVVELHQFGR